MSQIIFPKKDQDGKDKVAIQNLTVTYEGDDVNVRFHLGKHLGRTSKTVNVYDEVTQRVVKKSLPGQGPNVMLAKTSGVTDIKLPDGTMASINAMIFRPPRMGE